MIPREGLAGWISAGESARSKRRTSAPGITDTDVAEQVQRIQNNHRDWLIMWSAWHRTFTAFSCSSPERLVLDEPTADGLVEQIRRNTPPLHAPPGIDLRPSAPACARMPVTSLISRQALPPNVERAVPSMKQHSLSRPIFSPQTPSPARMYDYYLGGKDNFPADREAAEKVLKAFPQARKLARDNRGFLLRAVKHCAQAGIDQFIDLGTGIPTAPGVAEIACAYNPAARVIGVDNDPVVLNHQRAAASYSPGDYTIIEADVRRPWAILADPKLSEVIDLSRPVAVLCVAVLHFISDAEDPAAIIAAFTQTMATGSFLALSAVTSTDTDPAVVAQIKNAYRDATAPVIFRTREHITSWFNGLDLIPPGVVEVCHWPTRLAVPTNVRILGGLARKPARHPS